MAKAQINFGEVGGSVGKITVVDTITTNNNTTYTYQKGDYVFFFATNMESNLNNTTGVAFITKSTTSYSNAYGCLARITASDGKFTVGSIGGTVAIIFRKATLTQMDTLSIANNTTYTLDNGDYLFIWGTNTYYETIASLSGLNQIANSTASYSNVGGGIYEITGSFTVGAVGGLKAFVFR